MPPRDCPACHCLLWGTEQAAEALGVGEPTLRDWVTDGWVRRVPLPGRVWRFSPVHLREDIARLMEARDAEQARLMTPSWEDNPTWQPKRRRRQQGKT